MYVLYNTYIMYMLLYIFYIYRIYLSIYFLALLFGFPHCITSLNISLFSHLIPLNNFLSSTFQQTFF